MHLESLESRKLMSAGGHAVTVPIHGQAEGNLAGNFVTGTEAHLGRFTGSFVGPGQLVFTSANGDELWVQATLTPTSPTEFVVEGNYVGGTGRFEGASGAFSHGLTIVDGQTNFVYEVDAQITLQRPWNDHA